MTSSLKQKAVTGAVWRTLEQIGSQGCNLVFGIVLARLLSPRDFGVVALLYVFIGVSNVLVSAGLGSGLVQQKQVTEEDYNSAFFVSLLMSLIVYAILFFSAPAIAGFYRQPILVSVLRWTALGLILNAMNGVQDAVMSRSFLFNLSFRISLVQSISHGVIGIILAYMGYGVWALVYGTLGSSFLGTLTRWYLIGWRPRLVVSIGSIKKLWRFGWKLMASGVISQFFGNIYGLIIGRVYTPSELSFYSRGQQLPSLAVGIVDKTTTSISFTALSRMQDNPEQFRRSMRRMIRSSCFFVMPTMILMAVCSKSLIVILLGQQWLCAVPYMQIACFSYLLMPFHSINLQAMNAMGRSDLFLKLEILKKLIAVGVIFCVYRHGVLALALAGAFLTSPLCVLINAWPNKKMLGYSLLMQIRDVLPMIGLSLCMGLFLIPVFLYVINVWRSLIMSVSISLIVYLGLARAMKLDAFGFYLTTLHHFSESRFPMAARLISKIMW